MDKNTKLFMLVVIVPIVAVATFALFYCGSHCLLFSGNYVGLYK